MSVTVFSSSGCIRCDIVKNYLSNCDLSFVEHNIKTDDGNDAFKQFYREHRSKVRRDENGIFFPVVFDGTHVVQDAGATLARFMCGNALDAAITPNSLGHGWIGGLNISACADGQDAAFLEILRLLKAGGLSTEILCNGKNAALLRKILDEKLADRLIFRLAAGIAEESDELSQSLRTAKECAGKAETLFFLDIQGPGGCLAPEEAAEFARLTAEATGDNRLPLRIFNSNTEDGINLLPYRTAARRWQVLTELA
jgi:pyruvate formate lyase activating enzyme